MRSIVLPRHGLLVLTLVAFASPLAGQAFTTAIAECGKQIQLQAAAGIPAHAVHTYEFLGSCRLLISDGKNNPKVVHTFPTPSR